MMTSVIQTHLAEKDQLPSEHIVDTGYVTSDHLVTSQEQQVDLLGPMREDNSWQTRAAAGFGVAYFAIDWEAEQATCPMGKTSAIWKPTTDNRGIPVINIRFAHTDCVACPQRSQFMSSLRSRALTIRERPAYEAAVSARQRQTTDEFKQAYAKRAGIEGTVLQYLDMCRQATKMIGSYFNVSSFTTSVDEALAALSVGVTFRETPGSS
jgi:Transposase DDE domain